MPKSGGRPIYKTLIVETIYPFSVIKFDAPINIPILKGRANASYGSPEDAVISQFSAMIGGNYEWFKETWTISSWQMMQETDKRNNRGSDFWLDLWRKNLASKSIQLTSWVNYGSYVLVEYQLVDKGVKSGIGVVALIKEGGQWKATQDLSKDPIFLNWKSSTGRIQVPPDTLLIK